VCVAKINVQAETTVPALHVLGAPPLGQMHCTIMLSKKNDEGALLVRASGTRDIGTRFDSKANGTGTLRQFVSKATRPKLPGGLLLYPGPFPDS
jgi:hypothetical protein